MDFAAILGMDLNDVAKSSTLSVHAAQMARSQVEDRMYLEVVPAGIDFDAEVSDGRVAAIFLYSDGYQDRKGFSGALPLGLSFSDSRQTVRKRLGCPPASGGGQVLPALGTAPPWDRYDCTTHSLHIQYCEDATAIILVTLMRPDRVPK